MSRFSPADETRSGAPRVDARPPAGPAGQGQDGDSVRPVADASKFVAKQFGEFRILRPLGRGGMSEVYLAEQTSLHRQVAVKILLPELLSDKTILKRFEREAKAVAGLIHPNIVQIYSFGSEGGVHYIAQEYVQGMNLRQYLNRKGPPELVAAYHIMRQVAAALAAAGDAGIVHRDIKPENILITRKGEAKVVDFGLAQLGESETRMHLTQVGITMGTPLYMSPEQINGHAVDHRSDIYSFGVTCYRMLSGRAPFQGETTLTLAMQHLTHTPERLDSLRRDLPPVLCEIVHKMMAREPADRYQHAREITQDLKKVARILKSDAESAGALKLAQNPRSPRPNKLVQRTNAFFAWSRARHATSFAIAALLVAGASSAVGWWLRPPSPLDVAAAQQGPIRKLASAKEQFEHAGRLKSDDEEAWKAVLQYFPEDRTYTPEAKERLAILYLKSHRLDDAGKLFEDLESMGRENPTAKAVGVAGRAVIASLQGHYKDSQRLIVYDLGDLQHQREQLTNDLWLLLLRAGRENVRHLGAEADKQLKGLFDDEPQ